MTTHLVKYWGYLCVGCQSPIRIIRYMDNGSWGSEIQHGTFTLLCEQPNCKSVADYPMAAISVLDVEGETPDEEISR